MTFWIMENNNFKDFTNLYEIIKTLRFELKPIEQTKAITEKLWIEEKDELRDKDYDIIKPIFDQLHDKFIRESLFLFNENWSELAKSVNSYKKEIEGINKKVRQTEDDKELLKLQKRKEEEKNNYEKKLDEFRKKITDNYEKIAEKWKNLWKDEKWETILKENWYKILTEAWILKVLKKIFENETEIKNLVKENSKAIEMMENKFIFYLKKIENEKDFSWWVSINTWENEKNFDKNQAKKYLEEILEKIYKKDLKEIQKQVLDVINNLNDFWTYFSAFNNNRENYYSSENKSTAVANRIVNENFITFIWNINNLEKIDISLSNQEDEIFKIENYNKYLSQEGIDEYNEIIWWKKDEKWVRIEDWINQRLNEYSQKNNKEKIQLKPLYKQIWSIKSKSIPFQMVETEEDFKSILEKLINSSKKNIPIIIEKLKNIFENDEKELEKIWISKNNLNFISNRYFSNWYILAEKWVELKVFSKKSKKDLEDGENFSIPKYISLKDFKEMLEKVEFIDYSDIEENKRNYFFKKYFEEKRWKITNNWEFFKKIFREDVENLYSWKDEEIIFAESGNEETFMVKSFLTYLKELEEIIKDFNTKNQKHKKILKLFADKSIFIFQFLRIFKVNRDFIEAKSEFYNFYDEIVEDFLVTKYYDAIRSYLTKKDFSKEKIKLNFNCWYLLNWWDSDFSTYWTLIFKKNDNFYIWIINWTGLSKENVEDLRKWITDENKIKKMVLETQKVDNKNPPRWFIRSKKDTFSPMVREKLIDPKPILEIYDKWLFSKNKNKDSYKQYLPKIIDYFKEWFRKHKDFEDFRDNFLNWSDSNSYETIADFYNETADLCYKLSWEEINFDKIKKLNLEEKIFLYQISSRDFNSNWNKNTQTELFLNLMNEKNNKFLKLLWQWEIFFRKSSSFDKKIIETKKWIKIEKDFENPFHLKRYSSDKIFLHFPITIKWRSLKEWFNSFLNTKIWNPDFYKNIHIIWIDRWEKHLAFYSVINALTWEIVEQWSLNIINWVDYERLLSQRAYSRLKAKQDWESIWNIKNLKEWYISQIVKKISDLVLKYNWIVVMEKLNKWFKRWRQKIEKSIYQNLEVSLVKKLSYLTVKWVEDFENWSIIKAYQLCPLAKNYSDIEKSRQWWILFYANPAYTSVTDPITWWRKNIYLSKWKLEEMKKNILDIFFEIWFDEKEKAYFFKYKISWKEWILYSGRERWRWTVDKKTWKWKIYEIFTTDELDKLFEENEINKNKEIISQIKEKTDLKGKFFESLIWIIDVILQIRNKDDKENDMIISPVKPFFNSKTYFDQLSEDEKNEKFEHTNYLRLPTSWDANWAYNIARKWQIMLEKIQKNPKINQPKLLVNNEQWDEFIQKS